MIFIMILESSSLGLDIGIWSWYWKEKVIEIDTTIDERERARLILSNAFVREREALIDISFKIAHDLSIILHQDHWCLLA